VHERITLIFVEIGALPWPRKNRSRNLAGGTP
jgi:hypothetical protein